MVQTSSMISMASVFAISRICNHFGVPFYVTMMCQVMLKSKRAAHFPASSALHPTPPHLPSLVFF